MTRSPSVPTNADDGSGGAEKARPAPSAAANGTTERHIERAAVDLFAHKGFDGASVREIAASAGVGLSALYYYAESKEQLLLRIMKRALSELLEPAREACVSVPDPRTRIERLARLHVHDHITNQQRCVVSDTELRALSAANRAAIISMRDEYDSIWREAIAAGMDTGVFSVGDHIVAALALVEMCTSVAHWYRPGGRLTAEGVADLLAELCLGALGARGELESIGLEETGDVRHA